MELLQVLILAGGFSSRMGSPKHLLALPDGPLYLHLTRIVRRALPETTVVYISIASRSVLDDPLRNGTVSVSSLSSKDGLGCSLPTVETIMDAEEHDIGPAAGLLAAHHFRPAATWLVMACDYPLLQAAAIRQLIDSYEPPATCFQNMDGFSEPLLGIWDPQALRKLDENVKMGRLGPSYTLKSLDTKLLKPIQEEWLTNVNTREDWEAAKMNLNNIHTQEDT